MSNFTNYLCNTCSNSSRRNRNLPIFNIQDLVTIPNLQDQKCAIGCYVNPEGAIHDTITVQHSDGIDHLVDLHGETPITKHSWFPGYGWIIASCTYCDSHLGWKFIKVEQATRGPEKFYGFTRSGIVLDKFSVNKVVENLNQYGENYQNSRSLQDTGNHNGTTSREFPTRLGAGDLRENSWQEVNLDASSDDESLSPATHLNNSQNNSAKNSNPYLSISDRDFKYLVYSKTFKNIEADHHWEDICQASHNLPISEKNLETMREHYMFSIDRKIFQHEKSKNLAKNRVKSGKSISDIDINWRQKSIFKSGQPVGNVTGKRLDSLNKRTVIPVTDQVQDPADSYPKDENGKPQLLKRSQSCQNFNDLFLNLMTEQVNLPKTPNKNELIADTISSFKNMTLAKTKMLLKNCFHNDDILIMHNGGRETYFMQQFYGGGYMEII